MSEPSPAFLRLNLGPSFFHLGSMSEPSPAFLRLNLGPSFFWEAFHSSRVSVFISSSTGSLSSAPSSLTSPSAGASPSTGAASSTEVLLAVSSPSLASSSKVPQFPFPPPPRLSSALIPVLPSPDFLSYSLFPPRPPSNPPLPPPPSILPLPAPSPLPLPRPLPLPSPSSSRLIWFPPSWFLMLFLSSL